MDGWGRRWCGEVGLGVGVGLGLGLGYLLLGERREAERVQVGVLQPQPALVRGGACGACDCDGGPPCVAHHGQRALEVLGRHAGVADQQGDAPLEPFDLRQPKLQLGLRLRG